jgi:hypothetical protein
MGRSGRLWMSSTDVAQGELDSCDRKKNRWSTILLQQDDFAVWGLGSKISFSQRHCRCGAVGGCMVSYPATQQPELGLACSDSAIMLSTQFERWAPLI